MDIHTSTVYGGLSASEFKQRIESTLENVSLPITDNDILLGLMGISDALDQRVLKAYTGPRKANYYTYTGIDPESNEE